MALADWEVILGGGLKLNSVRKVSGSKSLSQDFNGGATHIVHSATYNDAPKNVEVRTWMTLENCDNTEYEYLIGAISRKQQGEKTYFYWCLIIRVNSGGNIMSVKAQAGYYSNGTQNAVVDKDVKGTFVNSLGSTWVTGNWRFVRMVGYESGGVYNIAIDMTPDITSPDVSNPPLDQLKGIFSATIDIPQELQNGGACGLIVGGVDPYQNNTIGAPFYDYTQLFY